MKKIPELLVLELGISPQANGTELKAAYRRFAMKHHPDRNEGKESEVFNRVTKLYNRTHIPCGICINGKVTIKIGSGLFRKETCICKKQSGI